MNLNGKTVVVIGAGSGIGRAVAVDAANAGATLILGGRTAPPLKETARLAGGTEGFVKAMALELGPVRVNAISPGIVDSGPFWSRLTPEGRERMFADFALRAPAQRVGVPAEQANAVLFALTNPFLTGSVLPIDGGALLM